MRTFTVVRTVNPLVDFPCIVLPCAMHLFLALILLCIFSVKGATNAFFIREKAPGGEYRVVIHAEEGATAVLPSEKFEAIEVRFPTEDGLLYQITLSATIGHSLEELVFLLGDGAKQSYFERIVNGEARFFEVYKY